MTAHTIGTVDDFPSGRGTPVDVDGVSMAVFNLDGDFFAVQNVCPHKNLPLHLAGHEKRGADAADADDAPTMGSLDAADATIECPWHYLEWDLETGHSHIRDERIPTYDVEVEDGEVRVDL